jgi:hypothetical protein
MAQTRQNRPSLLLDLLIVAVGGALLIVASRFGLEAGHPPAKGVATVLGGLYVIYLGMLFLLSYFFSDACYVFSFLCYLCEACSYPAGRRMAWFYFALSLLIGSGVLLVGFGVL